MTVDILYALGRGPLARPRHATTGDASLLVLVDSSGHYHARRIVDETVLRPLEHFGLPYRLLDLAYERPTAAALSACAGLLIAQDAVAGRLTAGESALISQAVSAGIGLVNLDWDLRACDEALLEILGLGAVDRLPIASDVFYVRDADHYLTWLQAGRSMHQSQRMVTGLMVGQWRADVTPLVEMVMGKEQLVYTRHLVPGSAIEPRHYPVVFAGRWGQGKAVQFAVNPRLWRNAAMGHLGGLGDLFWRSILWTVRKPFAANAIPPFVSMSFDDCSGRHDYRYLDICRRHGYMPLASLFIDEVQTRHLPFLQGRALAGDILVNTHAMSYYELQLYDFGVGESSSAALTERFARDDDFFARLGAPCAQTVRHHWGENGVASLPFLKARGRTAICTPIHFGEHKTDQFQTGGGRQSAGEGFWPYDATQCFYDVLPDDNDFYMFGAFNERQQADFLTGATMLLRESPVNQIERAAEGAAYQIRHGLSTGFFADVLTHEQKFTVLELDEWDQILARAGWMTERFEKHFASHDQIVQYLRGRDGTWLSQAARQGDTVEGRLSGPGGPLKLVVYSDVADGVEQHYLEVPAFANEIGFAG